MNAATNIATPTSFSLDRFCAFARDAVLGDQMVKGSREGLSEQLWAGLVANPAKFPDDARDSFDGFVLSLLDAKKGSKERLVGEKLKAWKKKSPLAARLSECRKVAKWASDNEAHAASVWASGSLSAALKFIKTHTTPKATKGDGEGEPVHVAVPVSVEANATEGADLLADIRAYLASASEADRLALLCELDSIVNGEMWGADNRKAA